YESFKKESFNNFLGFDVDFCQDNISYSTYGVIRGLHTNTLIYSQSKLVNVLKGKILDVAVDFRKGSPTFGKSISIELNSE
ncbi:dTDP-4-dehydrorhamnose 3,5-epimerase, partial [Aliarcobacter butzleri]